MNEPTPDDNAKSEPAISSDTLADLKAMAVSKQDKPKTEDIEPDKTSNWEETYRRNQINESEGDVKDEQLEAAWSDYAGYGEYYQKVNAERAERARAKIEKFGPVTIIASINVDHITGRAIDGHDYNPGAENHRDIEAAWQKYLAETPLEERIVVFEGNSESFDDRDVAIEQRTEAGMMMFLADQEGVERTSGEPRDLVVAEEFEKVGISREETALLFTLRSLATHASSEPIGDMKFNFYPHMQSVGFEGFPLYTEEQKKVFKTENGQFVDSSPEAKEKRTQINREIFEKISPYVDKWNVALESYGLPKMLITDSQEIIFEDPVSRGDVAESGNPSGEGLHSERMAQMTAIRDKHIFETIVEATSAGKKPFVVYGGSHVVSLEPVLKQYYGSQRVLE